MATQEQWEVFRDVELDFKYGNIFKDLSARYDKGELVVPAKEYWNNYLNFDIGDIKVVIIGDCPYKEWYASDGFAFSSLLPNATNFVMSRLYDKLYYEIGVQYDKNDNSKEKWLDRGILCLPYYPIIYNQDESIEYDLREQSEDVLRFLIEDSRPKVFISLISYNTKTVTELLYKAEKNGHLAIQVPIISKEFMKIPIFTATNNFILKEYKTILDWT